MAGRKGFGGISESDFDRLLTVLSTTTKGRAFLESYRQRCGPAETAGLLSSLQRIETTMASVRDHLQPESIAGELRHIAMTLDIALDGADADPEGSEAERRFALVGRARYELLALAESVLGDVEARVNGEGSGRPAQPEAGDASLAR